METGDNQEQTDTSNNHAIVPQTSSDQEGEHLDAQQAIVDGLNKLELSQRSDLLITDLLIHEDGIVLYFNDERHDASVVPRDPDGEGLVAKWRSKERLKTTAVALVMALNIGVTPPDVVQISPCARLINWVDPFSMQAPKALDTIGKNLQAQYERWQPRAKYRLSLDPTTSDVQRICLASRKTAKNERVLFHFNGLGVPRPTTNGEIWVFNKSYTQYIPLSLYDLQSWLGTPAIYVFDCSMAGQILSSFKQFMIQRQQELDGYPAYSGPDGSQKNDPMRDCILLCSCSDNELLPQNPDLPADVFTSCLTTPIKIALRWFCSRSLLRHEGVTKELIDRIPGKQTDRKTPLGELNWIFTAITDTIAWNVLPRALFQKLFRQDLLVASLFRNFLLAERIMRAANCTPVSHPRLPPTHQHFMWQAWDMAAEMCLLQLPELLNGDGTKEYQPSPFFSEQLTAFELWLEHGSPDKRPPEQLPIVLQVLLSQVHRLRALVLLGRFLDLGSWAVDLALSVGIFPYVLKLLQTTAADLRQTLVFIWTKILAWDANSQVQSDLVKDGGHVYFIKHLESRDPAVTPESRAQAAFVLAAICNRHQKGQLLCAQSGLLQLCAGQLPATLAAMHGAEHDDPSSARRMGLLVKWLLLCIGKLVEDVPEITAGALREQVHDILAKVLSADDPEIRAAAIFSLGSLIQAQEDLTGETPAIPEGDQNLLLPEQERMVIERAIACALLEVVYDASPMVRSEVARALARFAMGHQLFFQDAVHAHQQTAAKMTRAASADSVRSASSSAPIESRSYGTADTKGSVPLQSTRGSIGVSSASPGVRVRDDQSYEPLLHVVMDGNNITGGGVYASADAARVGGGLYLAVVEALVTLATDPSPQVQSVGIASLKAANVEILSAAQASASTESAAMAAPGTSGKEGGMSSFLPKSWQSKSWRSSAARSSAPIGSLGSRQSSPGTSPRGGALSSTFVPRQAAVRQPLMVRRIRDVGDSSMHGGQQAMSNGPLSARALPASIVYSTSWDYYRWPILSNKNSTREHQMPWLKTPDQQGIDGKLNLRERAIARCVNVNSQKLKITEQVVTMDVGSEHTAALLFDSFEPLITTISSQGFVHVSNYAQQSAINAFAVAPASSGLPSQPVSVKSLFLLNEMYNSLLVACADDGAVRIWRNYSMKGGQKLATAWQSCLVSATQSPVVFSLPQDSHSLFVGKGSTILSWDMAREICIGQISLPETDDGGYIQHLVGSTSGPLVYAADNIGNILAYDLRSQGEQPIWSLRPLRSPLVAMVEPGPDSLCIGYDNGQISFLDTRGTGANAITRTVEAHTTALKAMSAHPNAPLLGTVSATQAVKVWSLSGEKLAVVRPKPSYLDKVGYATCCTWHPYALKFSVGASDNYASIYTLTDS